jgi:CheY-like chemotaxis protein
MVLVVIEVLVIDADTSTCEELTRALAGEGYRTKVAKTLRRTLRLVDREPPDVILVEPDLPDAIGLSGETVVRRLRSAFKKPLLVLSGTARRTRRSRRSKPAPTITSRSRSGARSSWLAFAWRFGTNLSRGRADPIRCCVRATSRSISSGGA